MSVSRSADLVNRAAKLVPITDAESLPAIEVGGVLVLVYRDGGGTLRVSVNLDAVDPAVFPLQGDDDRVPLRVTVQGDTVFEADAGAGQMVRVGLESRYYRTVTVPWARLAEAWRADQGIPQDSGEEPTPGQLEDRELDDGEVSGLFEEFCDPDADVRIVHVVPQQVGEQPDTENPVVT